MDEHRHEVVQHHGVGPAVTRQADHAEARQESEGSAGPSHSELSWVHPGAAADGDLGKQQMKQRDLSGLWQSVLWVVVQSGLTCSPRLR